MSSEQDRRVGGAFVPPKSKGGVGLFIPDMHHDIQVDDVVIDTTAEREGWDDVEGKVLRVDGTNVEVEYLSGNVRFKLSYNLRKKSDIQRQELIDLAIAMVEVSKGKLSLAHNEEDESTVTITDAAHFLKLDGKRLGRDIELYGFMGDSVMGWQKALTSILLELVMPLQESVPEAYKEACELLKEMGSRVYPDHLRQEWEELLG